MNAPNDRLIVCNWKANGTKAEALALFAELRALHVPRGVALVVCPSLPALGLLSEMKDHAFLLGAQDCSPFPQGAHTGDVTADMLKSYGAGYVILGHSERRGDWAETDDLIRRKAEAALASQMTPILCVGETQEEKDAGRTLDVIRRQLAHALPEESRGPVVIAYEPRWAIGRQPAVTPGLDDICEVHALLKSIRPDATLLYGGSMNETNARELLAVSGVDGGLIGGASLDAGKVAAIVTEASYALFPSQDLTADRQEIPCIPFSSPCIS